MRRREFHGVLGAGAAWPFGARASQVAATTATHWLASIPTKGHSLSFCRVRREASSTGQLKVEI